MGSSEVFERNRSRAVPRGPSEWGRLLHEPIWAVERRYPGGREIYMDSLVMGIGIMLAVMGAGLAIVEVGLGLVLLGMGALVTLVGYGMVRAQVTRMPFRVYERGFTKTSVPFSQGLKRRESLVYHDMLEKVTIDSTSFQGITLNQMKVLYTGPQGSSEEMVLSFEDPDNPLDVMVLFRDIAPEKLDPSLDPYVGKDGIDAAVPVPFEDRQGSTSHDTRGIVMSTAMMAFVAVLSGFLFVGLDLHPVGLVFGGIFQLVMYVVFIGMASMLAVRGFKTSVGDTARVKGDRLTLPRSNLVNLYADTRPFLPLIEVREVRKAVDTTFFGHKALMVTAAGERLVARHTLWQDLREHPSFELEGFVLRNRRPFTGRPRPLVAVNGWKQLAVAMSMLLLSMLLGLFSGGTGEDFFEAWDQYSPYLIGGFLGIMVPLYIVLRILIAKRASRGEGIMSSDMGLMMPGSDGSPHWVSKGEVRSATVNKDLLGFYIELRTAEGVEKLPLSAAPKMERAGIPVEDGFGILTHVPEPDGPDMVTPLVDGTEAPPRPPERRVRVSGRGMLLSEMPGEKVESERRRANTFGLATTVGAILFGALLLTAPGWLLGDTFCAVFLGIMVVFLGLLGVLLMVAARRMGPVRVYENGVEWASIAKGLHFLGWGDFSSARESTLGGSRMLTLTKDNRPAGSISADLPGYDEWMPMIMERVADPAWATESEDVPESATRYWAVPTALLVVSIGLGIGTAAFAGSDMDELLTISGWDLYLLLGMSTALGYFFVLMAWMMFRNTFGLTKARFPTAALVMPVAAMVLVYLVALGSAGPVSIAYSVDIVESEDPGTSVMEVGEYTDTEIVADGPVTVGAGETLTLHNVSILFDPAPGLDYGIWVHPDGKLLMDDVHVSSVDPGVGFCFEIHGKAVILDSVVVGTANDPDIENGEGGVELYCGDIRVENSRFENAQSASVMTVYCSPIIRNCTFTGALDEGIEVHGGTPLIEGCTFSDCEWPIILWNGSEAEIVNCTFVDCPRGIDMAQSSATIRGCTFLNIEDYAIQWTSDTDPEPVMEDNMFENVGTETDVQTVFASMGSICTGITMATAVIGTMVLLRMNRSRPERVSRKSDPEIIELGGTDY